MLALVSEICASTAAAEPQSAEQEQPEKTAVDHALRDYNDAFGRGDLPAIGQHCDVPLVRISSQGVKVCATMSEIEALYGGIQRDLRERGYSHSTVSELHVKLLDQSTALASAVFVRHKTDGSELETIGATYVLHVYLFVHRSQPGGHLSGNFQRQLHFDPPQRLMRCSRVSPSTNSIA